MKKIFLTTFLFCYSFFSIAQASIDDLFTEFELIVIIFPDKDLSENLLKSTDYILGNNVEKDPLRASLFLRKAVKENNKLARYLLVRSMEEGLIPEKYEGEFTSELNILKKDIHPILASRVNKIASRNKETFIERPLKKKDENIKNKDTTSPPVKTSSNSSIHDKKTDKFSSSAKNIPERKAPVTHVMQEELPDINSLKTPYVPFRDKPSLISDTNTKATSIEADAVKNPISDFNIPVGKGNNAKALNKIFGDKLKENPEVLKGVKPEIFILNSELFLVLHGFKDKKHVNKVCDYFGVDVCVPLTAELLGEMKLYDKTQIKMAKKNNTINNKHYVQLASSRNEIEGITEKERLINLIPSIFLKDLDVKVEKTSSTGTFQYAIRIRGFKNAKQSKSFCKSIELSGLKCIAY